MPKTFIMLSGMAWPVKVTSQQYDFFRKKKWSDCLRGESLAYTSAQSSTPFKVRGLFVSVQGELKVDGNEKLGGPKRRQQLNFSQALWRSRVILNLNVYFLCKIHFFRFRLLQLFE